MKEFLLKLLTVAIAILAPIKAVMIAVGVLVIADMITGVWAAIKRSEKITSAGFRRTVSKLVIYQIAIITGFVVEHYLVDGSIPIVKIIGGVIGLVELKSVLENANSISGTDIFQLILNRLGSQNDIKEIVESGKKKE